MVSFNMLRSLRRLSPITYTAIIPFKNLLSTDFDEVKNDGNVQDLTDGSARVHKMFQIDDFGEPSAELHSVVQATTYAGFIGACIGGFVRSRTAYMNFIETNEATIFKSIKDAKKKLQDHVTIAFGKGAFQWGWRMAFFTGTFCLVSTVISVYQGETGLIEYIAAGALTGALYKLNLGLAATLVGGGLGAILGMCGGLLTLAILKLTGFSLEDIRNTMYKFRQIRNDSFSQYKEDNATEKNDRVTRQHDAFVKAAGVKMLEDIE